VRAIDALSLSGDGVRAGVVAEDAYRRFADHPDPATAALACHRAAFYRAIGAPAAGLPPIEEALRLFEQAPPSADQAEAWHDYADIFLWSAEGRNGAASALNRALDIAEAAGATALISRVQASVARGAFLRGQIKEGHSCLQQGWALAQASQDSVALLTLAVSESDALLKLAKFQNAADIALRGIESARQTGLEASWGVNNLANAAEALLAVGRTAEAAALIDPLTTGPPDRDHWLVHETRAEIDLLRGDIGAAAGRRQLIDAFPPTSAAWSSPASLGSGPRSWRCGPDVPAMPWMRFKRRLPWLKPRA
jgi:tetratricopeptide (TPR) repeat protein